MGGFPRLTYYICRLRGNRDDFTALSLVKSTACRTKQTAFVWPNATNHIQAKTNTTQKGGLCFWWEWVDSNHLSRKTTDLQSAPALQLRRTPNLARTFLSFLVRAAGIEPAFQAWKACILALELCSQRFSSPLIISYFLTNASIYYFICFFNSLIFL